MIRSFLKIGERGRKEGQRDAVGKTLELSLLKEEVHEPKWHLLQTGKGKEKFSPKASREEHSPTDTSILAQ